MHVRSAHVHVRSAHVHVVVHVCIGGVHTCIFCAQTKTDLTSVVIKFVNPLTFCV